MSELARLRVAARAATESNGAQPKAPEPPPPPAEAPSVAVVTFEVKGWTLGRMPANRHPEVPLVRDVDLAEKLGYQRPRKIRDLIDRMVNAGQIDDVSVRPTVGRTSMQRGGERVLEVTEYWVTQAQALNVAARSETAPADLLLNEMIHVFQLAMAGELPGQVNAPDASVALLASLVERQAAAADRRLERLEGLVEKLALRGGAALPAPVVTLIPEGWLGAKDVAMVLLGRPQRRAQATTCARLEPRPHPGQTTRPLPFAISL